MIDCLPDGTLTGLLTGLGRVDVVDEVAVLESEAAGGRGT